MNTKLIMILSAAFLALVGISLTFLPNEVAGLMGISSVKSFPILLQMLGALYFAFAMLNWMAKGAIIGGIYNRPIVMANLTHFAIGAITLLKAIFGNPALPYQVWILAGVYSIFAIVFWLIFSRHPASDKNV